MISDFCTPGCWVCALLASFERYEPVMRWQVLAKFKKRVKV